MRTIKPFSLGVLSALGVVSLAVIGCSKPEPTKPPFATVNGVAITEAEFLSFMERKPTVQVATPQGDQELQVAGMLGLQGLRDMVNRKLILQLAKEDGVLPTDADVEKELKFQLEQKTSFVAQLVEQGVPDRVVKDDILVALSRERLQTKGITVSPAEVDAYVKENQANFMEPAKASLQWIFVSDSKKKDLVDKDLKAGQSFATVAARYSEAPNARQDNGAFGVDQIDQMPPQLQALVAKTAAGKETAWLPDGKNFVKFFVISKSPKRKLEMTETRKETLRRGLAMQKGQATVDLSKRITDKLRAASVVVNNEELKAPWQKAFETAKAQMAQQEAAAMPPTGQATPGTAPTPTGR